MKLLLEFKRDRMINSLVSLEDMQKAINDVKISGVLGLASSKVEKYLSSFLVGRSPFNKDDR